MRRRQRSAREETGIDLTPMLDVVFIMLIFFVVTASFVKESGIDVRSPQAATAEQKAATILITITAGGEVWMQKRPIDLRSVRANVGRLLAEHPQSGVVIDADRDARTGVLVQVMDQARLAGATEIAVAAEPRR